MIIKSLLSVSVLVSVLLVANSVVADHHGGEAEMKDASKKMASVYKCSHNESTRSIEVLYPNSPEVLPCEVLYTKESGEIQTPYSAQNSTGYCEEKATALVTKLKGWGWSCNEG